MNTALFDRESPWPQKIERECVFILDVPSVFEKNLLTDWVNHNRPNPQAKSHIVTLDMSDDTRAIEADELLSLLSRDVEARLVPLRVAWLPTAEALASGPRVRDLLMGDPRRPKRRKAQRLVDNEIDRVHLLAGRSATLGELKERFLAKNVQPENAVEQALAAFIALQASVALDVAGRRLQGGRYKVPRHVSDVLRNSPAFLEEVESLAAREGRASDELLKEADVYMKEMVSRPRTFWLDVYAKFNNFCLGLGYEDKVVIDPQAIEELRTVVRNHPAILLWTHKTYLDGMVVPKVMYDNDFPTPHMFGGANLSFAGLGFLLRRAGAIFIRRSFQDNELYKITLRHYIGLLMEKRFPMNWSFEGTRSRLGKLMPPRYGLLKYVLEACYATDARDIHIVPVTISYDLIRDVEEYAGEQTGLQKSPESLRWLIGYIRSLAKPMGKVYMDIGEPVVLDSAPEPSDRLALSKIAFQVAVQANAVTPITFPSLVTTSLLGAAPRAQTEQQVIHSLGELLGYAEQRGLRISDDFDRGYAEQIDGLLGLMIAEGIVTRYDQGPDIVYGISPEQHTVASYYRNTVIHYFVNKAIIELALLKATESPTVNSAQSFWSEVDALRDLFKFEFFYAPSEQFRKEIVTELTLCAPNWEAQLALGADSIVSLLEKMRPTLAHATLRSYVEAYSVVANVFTRLSVDQSIDEQECVKQALTYGHQAYLQRRISSEASIGKLLFSNAFKLMEHRQLHSAGDADIVEQRLDTARELRSLVLRLDRLQAIVVSKANMEWV